MLFGVIGAGVVVVAALAVLTPTVIVNDDSPEVGLVAAVAPSQIAPPGLAPAPRGGPRSLPGLPGLPGQRPFGDLRGCLEKHGLGRPGRSGPLDLGTLHGALRACRGAVPGAPPTR
jgi:hypothetical protein